MSASVRRALVIGGGGREHALAWLFREAGYRVFVAPGNGGTALEQDMQNVELGVADTEAHIAHAQRERYDIVVVGPEAPLAAGIGDRLLELGLPCIAPTRAASRLEWDKAWAKCFMDRAGVLSPSATVCVTPEQVRTALSQQGTFVIKASGLAGGKGVFLGSDDELIEAADALLSGSLGEAGRELLVEERIEGDEYSVFALTDGERFVLLPPVRDHKRAYEGDVGPNTGGMGAIADPEFAEPGFVHDVHAICERTLTQMRSEGAPFVGVLYFGLMVSSGSLQVLEFNARFGDPELQVLAPTFGAEIAQALIEISEGRLEMASLRTAPRSSVAISVVSADYPHSGVDGVPLTIEAEGLAFHAGTAIREGHLIARGGRVVTAVGVGDSQAEAADAAYALAASVRFEGARFREDIAR